jgi:antitoxin ParD1/3/4
MRETLNISLKADQKRWVKEEMERGGFATASELFREMIRERQRDQIRAEVEADLLAALDSGPSKSMTRKDWERLRARARKHIGGARRRA